MRWTSPSHRPLRSTDTSTAVRGKPLSNRRIDHYTRLGLYGPDAKRALEARKKKPSKRTPRPSHLSVLDSLTLDDILA